ncbi:Nn.00g036840.m01.CDS01 [Neocucurbitaria sp. VM-36]
MEGLQKIPILRMMARPTAAPVNPPPRPPTETASEGTPITSPRSLRQLSIFFLGGACLLASTAITRKAIWRRQLRVKPKFYEANTNPHEYFSPFQDACQALNMATMNCASVGIMALGGIMWAFDIANVKEAQASLRGRLNYDSIYQSEDAVPQTISEMLKASQEMRIQEEGESSSKDKDK